MRMGEELIFEDPLTSSLTAFSFETIHSVAKEMEIRLVFFSFNHLPGPFSGRSEGLGR